MMTNPTSAGSIPPIPPIALGDDGLEPPRRTWSMIAIWLAVTMAVLDTVVANIALPTIARELGTTAADAVWVVNAYQLAVVILLLPLAALGEILGYKRVYQFGLVVFVVASVGCALADGLVALSIWRFVQGVGGAAIMSLNGALIRATYPRALLGRGIGYNAMVVAIASAAGPSVAAAILEVASWRWIFAINLPLGVASLLLGLLVLPQTPAQPRRFDIAAALASALALAALFFGVDTVVRGDGTSLGVLLIVVGVAVAWWLVRRERLVQRPLIPLDLIAVPVLRNSYVASVFAFASQMAAFVVLPFHLHALGFSALAIGLVMTAFPAGTSLAAPLSGRLMDRFSAFHLGGAGLFLLAAASIALAVEISMAGAFWIALSWGVCGFGFGLFQTPNNRVMLGEAPRERSGAAAGMLAMSRLVGQTLGALAAVLGFRLWAVGSGAAFAMAAGLAALAAIASLRRARVAG